MSDMESIIGRATNPDEYGDCWKYAVQDRAFLLQRIVELETRLDALMFEYCPDEMTKEQVDTWAAHQEKTNE